MWKIIKEPKAQRLFRYAFFSDFIYLDTQKNRLFSSNFSSLFILFSSSRRMRLCCGGEEDARLPVRRVWKWRKFSISAHFTSIHFQFARSKTINFPRFRLSFFSGRGSFLAKKLASKCDDEFFHFRWADFNFPFSSLLSSALHFLSSFPSSLLQCTIFFPFPPTIIP